MVLDYFFMFLSTSHFWSLVESPSVLFLSMSRTINEAMQLCTVDLCGLSHVKPFHLANHRTAYLPPYKMKTISGHTLLYISSSTSSSVSVSTFTSTLSLSLLSLKMLGFFFPPVCVFSEARCSSCFDVYLVWFYSIDLFVYFCLSAILVLLLLYWEHNVTSDMLMSLALFFLFRVALATFNLLCFHINFKSFFFSCLWRMVWELWRELHCICGLVLVGLPSSQY